MEHIEIEIRALREDVKALSAQLDGVATAQCAAFLGKSPDILYEWRKERKGPPFLHISPRSIMYDRDTVIEWAHSHEVK